MFRIRPSRDGAPSPRSQGGYTYPGRPWISWVWGWATDHGSSEGRAVEMFVLIPTRGLMGWRGNFLTKTRGKGILTSVFHSFVPWKGAIAHRSNGVLISINSGKSNAYACFNLQGRGTLFIGPGEDVYEGMIVGENTRSNDLVVNITKG